MRTAIILSFGLLLSACRLGDRFHANLGGGTDMAVSGGDGDMGGDGQGDMSPDNACQGCGGMTPICNPSTHACEACSSNAQCASATNAMQPVCDLTGACVGCMSNKDCPASAPICDTTSGSCGPCTAHTQCASGVCYQGTCLDSSKVIYVYEYGASCPTGPGAGTMASPYCTVQKGFDAAAASPGSYLAVRDGTYAATTGNTLLVNNPSSDYVVTAIAVGTVFLQVGTMQGHVVSVTNTTPNRVALTLDGFTIRNASNDDDQGLGNGDGVNITGGTDGSLTSVTLRNCSVLDNDIRGVSILNGTLTIDNTTIDKNGLQGILANSSTVVVTNSTISESGYNKSNPTYFSAVNGMDAVGSKVVLDRDTFGPKNGASGISMSNSSFTITNTLVHHNGYAQYPSGGIHIEGTAKVSQVVFNTTVADNAGMAPGIDCADSTPVIANTVVFNDSAPQVATVAKCSTTKSAFSGGGTPDLSSCAGKVFANVAMSNYKPLTGSPASCSLIGQGANSVTPPGGTTVTTDHDILGAPRPLGRYDIGAYQVGQ